MKKAILIFFIFLSIKIFPQIIISPYIVYTDEEDRYGSFVVLNESDEIYEVNISFKFGFPVSDSSGNISMNYIEDPTENEPSIVEWIRAFPRKFVLNPQQRQVIRMAIQPPEDIPSGTYWARIFTSSSPSKGGVSTNEQGIRAQLKFVLNQVTTVLYRKGTVTTGTEIKNVKTSVEDSLVNIDVALERKGNSPFFGEVIVKILDNNYNVIAEQNNFISLYFNLTKRFSFNRSMFNNDISYKAEITILHNEKKDIPESKLQQVSPTTKIIDIDFN